MKYLMILCAVLMFYGCGGSNSTDDASGQNDSNPSDSNQIELNDAKVGEEILFNAADFLPIESIENIHRTQFYWDFGDYSAISFDEKPISGITTTYCYLQPGHYTVTLKVIEGVSSIVNAIEVWSYPEESAVLYTKNVEIEGDRAQIPPLVSVEPVFSLSFDGTIENSVAGGVAVEWVNGEGSYIAGIKGSAIDLTDGHYMKINDANSIIGAKEELTVTFWSRKRTTDSFGFIMDQYDEQSQYNFGTGKRFEAFIKKTTDTFCGINMRTTNSFARTQSYSNNGVRDTLWHHYALTYSSAQGRTTLYVDGRQIASTDGLSGATVLSDVALYIGGDHNGENIFDGYIDELQIFDIALNQEEIYEGFEVRHADFHGHTAQYIYVTIPGIVTSDSETRLNAYVRGGVLSQPMTLVNKNNLASIEKFKLVNAELDGSPEYYYLHVEITDAAGDQILFESEEKFLKQYDGAPVAGIDENNAIRIDGELFFPVTPWGLNNADVKNWVNQGWINSLYGQGFWGSERTVEGWGEYLAICSENFVQAIGPSAWEGQGPSRLRGNSDITGIEDYVAAHADHPAMMMWQWLDEPMLNGVSSGTLRSWTFKSHQLDDQHLVATNFMGFKFHPTPGYNQDQGRTFSYGYNAKQFGRKIPVADVLGFDYYPLDSAYGDNEATFARLTDIIDNIIAQNLGLLPVFSWVETANAGGQADNNQDGIADDNTPWNPSPRQLRMIVWLNVVHGIKGINWFHYFRTVSTEDITPDENFVEMNKFIRQITELTPIVLGPESIWGVTVEPAASDSDRIDFMVREDADNIYLFAVRLTEVAHQDKSQILVSPPAINTHDIIATFTIDGINGKTAYLYDEEGRSVAMAGNQLSDTFEPFAVHIYTIEK